MGQEKVFYFMSSECNLWLVTTMDSTCRDGTFPYRDTLLTHAVIFILSAL